MTSTINGSQPCVPVVEREIEEEGLEEDAVVMLMQGVIIALAFLSVKLVSKFRVPFMTECGSVILTGFFIGGILFFAKPKFGVAATKFDPEKFFSFILPPIIFEAGFSLTSSKSSLSSNMGTILLLAIVGTMVSTVIVGVLLYVGFGPVFGGQISLWESLAFGSLISAVDPVATLAVLSEVFPGSKPPMFYLVFGESVINDAVSIVLYTVCQGVLKLQQQEQKGEGGGAAASTFAVFVQFWGVFIGSILVGILLTLATALFLKLVDLRHHHTTELVAVTLSALSTYSLAQALGLSGIMAIFVAGRLTKHWVHHNLSVSNKVFLPKVVKAIAETAELYVFAYLGAAFWAYSDYLKWDIGFILSTFFLILLGRAANVFPLCFLSNQFRDQNSEKISWSEQIFMWFSGLRGAIAFALACYGSSTGVLKNGDRLMTTTLVTVMFTVFVFGGLAKPLLRYLELAPPEREDGREERPGRRKSLVAHADEGSDDEECEPVDTPLDSGLLQPSERPGTSPLTTPLDLFDDEDADMGGGFSPPPLFETDEQSSCVASGWARFRQSLWRASRLALEADTRYIKPCVCVQISQTDRRRERIVHKLLKEGGHHKKFLMQLRLARTAPLPQLALVSSASFDEDVAVTDRGASSQPSFTRRGSATGSWDIRGGSPGRPPRSSDEDIEEDRPQNGV